MDIQAEKLELIKAIANIQSEELVERLKHFLNLVDKGKISSSTSLSQEEANLILKINEGLPQQIQHTYNELLKKSVESTLSSTENNELIHIIPQVEAHQTQRLAYLIELAAIWDCTVDETMSKLGIEAPPAISS